METNENLDHYDEVKMEEEKCEVKTKKTFLKSFWKNIDKEGNPPISGTYWVNICDSIDVCGSMHQDSAYYFLPENKWMSDTMKKVNGKVTHWAYPIPPPKDVLYY